MRLLGKKTRVLVQETVGGEAVAKLLHRAVLCDGATPQACGNDMSFELSPWGLKRAACVGNN